MNPYAVKVATPFAPTDIAGLTLWLNADAIVGLVNDDPVATWEDESGNNDDATQGTGANQPTYKTNIVNGLPVVRFDGGNDYLQTTSLTAQTLFIVCNHGDGATFSNYRRLIQPTAAAFHYYGDNGTGNYAIGAGITGGNFRVNGAATMSAGTLSAFRVVGIEADAAATDTYPIGISIGGFSQHLLGDIAEIVAYSGVLSGGDRILVETYLMDKYGI